MPVFPADELSDLIARILKAAGAQDGNAWIVADHLVLASLSGVDTHGIVLRVGIRGCDSEGQIPVEEDVWQSIVDTAQSIGVEVG